MPCACERGGCFRAARRIELEGLRASPPSTAAANATTGPHLRCVVAAVRRYAVESGKFEVHKRGDGKINEMGPGYTFGELALIYGAKRSATVLCVSAASLWALDRSTFRHYRAHNERRMKDTVVEVLKNVPLLKDLEADQLAKAAEVARTVEHQEGDVIIHKGEMGNTFYILLEGVVICTEASLGDDGDGGGGGGGGGGERFAV